MLQSVTVVDGNSIFRLVLYTLFYSLYSRGELSCPKCDFDRNLVMDLCNQYDVMNEVTSLAGDVK